MRFSLLFIMILMSACNAPKVVVSGSTEVADSEIISFSYSSSEYFGITSLTALTVSPSVDGDNLSFSILPALPAGLTLNTATGAISGTPTVDVDDQTYTVRVENSVNFKETTFNLTILPGLMVNTMNAGTDDSAGVGACLSTAAGGGCSLQAAIETTNVLAGKNIIILGTNTYNTNAGSGITDDLVIVGNGKDNTVINPTVIHPGYRFLTMPSNVSLKLADLSVTGYGANDGATIYATDGSVTLTRSKFQNNRGTNGGVLRMDGDTILNVTDSTFDNNGNSNWGGVLHIQNTAVATFDRCYFTNNVGAYGSVSHVSAGATVNYLNSTFYANVSTNWGTIATPGGSYNLTNVTMVANTNTGIRAPAIFFYNPAAITIVNSIIAFNTQSDGIENNCYQRTPATTNLTSLGNNIVSDAGGNCEWSPGLGDQLSTDPLLSTVAPQDNGGSSPTFDMNIGSPALNGGNNTHCTSSYDQRGLSRIVNDDCDIGALESQD